MDEIKKYSGIVIAGLLALMLTYSLIMIVIYGYNINIKFYFGIGAVILLTLSYLFRRDWFNKLLGIVLILGAINLIHFNFMNSTLTFSWEPTNEKYESIGFHPRLFLILIIYTILNFRSIVDFLQNLFGKDSEDIEMAQNAMIERYASKLKNETEEKLKEIVNNKHDYQEEYVQAAEQLLKNSNNTN